MVNAFFQMKNVGKEFAGARQMIGAAPDSKTIHIAQKMEDPGRIAAADRSPLQWRNESENCRQARRKQSGTACRFATRIEGAACPFGRAHERVKGRPPGATIS